MKLYDNDAYRGEFMELVYGLLRSDGTNDRANQIIGAFDSIPAVEAEPLPPNLPLTLEQLREMDGEPVWICHPLDKRSGAWALVDLKFDMCRVAGGGITVFENLGKTWLAYRHRPE